MEKAGRHGCEVAHVYFYISKWPNINKATILSDALIYQQKNEQEWS